MPQPTRPADDRTGQAARYPAYFYGEIAESGRRTAKVVVPLILDLVAPRSVVDVGCGAGVWLSVFAEQGIDDYLGIDGFWAWTSLEIPKHRFEAHDLAQPFELPRRFDLVVCLEVAEHLPPQSAAPLVRSLTTLGPVVLFSAAIPYQGGTQHQNEQWPEYWAALFAERGYGGVDVLRPAVWKNPDVEWWYAQNMILYMNREALARHESCSRAQVEPGPHLSLIRRELYTKILDKYLAAMRRADPANLPLRAILRALPRAAARSAHRMLFHWAA